MENYLQLNMTPAQIRVISNLGLAHIGDGVWELLCRSYLCAAGYTNVEQLHRRTIAMVRAPAQAACMERLLPLLTPEEQDIYRRGKNAHVHAVPKGATPAQYSMATGLEALFGALYLAGKLDRVNALFRAAFPEEE